MSYISPARARDSIVLSITKSAESDSTKIALCASLELASCRAENCQLRDNLTKCEATIQNLRVLVSRISEKQVAILAELVELRKKCHSAPINTLDTSTSTVEDGIDEWDGYMSDWEMEFSRTVSPLASSASTTSDLLQEDSELDPNPVLSWRRNEEEDNEHEDEDEDEDGDEVGDEDEDEVGNDDDEEDEDDDDSQPLSSISQEFLEDNWDGENY